MIRCLEFLLELLFPPRCAFCKSFLTRDESGLCAQCQNQLPWITGQAAKQELEFISCCVSPLWYQDNVRESIHRYKFSGRSVYAKIYGKLVAQCISDHLTGKYDLITWIPLSAKRLKMRGYDQAKLIAKAAARELNAEAKAALRKTRTTTPQSTLKDDADRRANVKGVYTAIDPSLVEGRRVLLIDDVVTTGSTLSECARILRACGAKDVVCATLSRARGKKTTGKIGK